VIHISPKKFINKLNVLIYMARKRGKSLKETLLEILKAPKTLEEVVKAVKNKKPRTKVRVIKALISRLKKSGEIVEEGGKLKAK